MSTKSAQLLRYMQENPDTEFSVQDIMEFMDCSYNHARLFTKRADVVEVLPGARPIVVKFNKERDKLYREKAASKVSVNRQIKDAANSLRSELPTAQSSGPAVDPKIVHSDCIPRLLASDEALRNLIEQFLDPNNSHPFAAVVQEMVAKKQNPDAVKRQTLGLWEIAGYLENNPYEFGV